jgi:serine phosphatase RsbU (regulator of sigma subunit)
LREEVIRSLRQRGSQREQKDGMDLALISINTDTLQCKYAGANNSLYIIRDSKLSHHKPDRMPISYYEQMDPFTSQKIQLQKGDQLYMFSDGYADQFGGEKRKKFKYAAFQNLLIKHSNEEMSEQHIILAETISNWQGDQEQIDDMVVVGIRV